MGTIGLILIVLILFGGLGGGWYGTRAGWAGPAWYPFGGIIGLLLLLLLLHAFGVF